MPAEVMSHDTWCSWTLCGHRWLSTYCTYVMSPPQQFIKTLKNVLRKVPLTSLLSISFWHYCERWIHIENCLLGSSSHFKCWLWSVVNSIHWLNCIIISHVEIHTLCRNTNINWKCIWPWDDSDDTVLKIRRAVFISSAWI